MRDLCQAQEASEKLTDAVRGKSVGRPQTPPPLSHHGTVNPYTPTPVELLYGMGATAEQGHGAYTAEALLAHAYHQQVAHAQVAHAQAAQASQAAAWEQYHAHHAHQAAWKDHAHQAAWEAHAHAQVQAQMSATSAGRKGSHSASAKKSAKSSVSVSEGTKPSSKDVF